MSFSSETKNELCRLTIQKKCCAQAEAYGILLYCNSFRKNEIKIITESNALAQRLPLLFEKAFHVEFDQRPTERVGKRTFLINIPSKLRTISEVFGYDPEASLAHHINFGILEEDHCRTAFFRGAFLAGGSATDPEKGYHLELATSHYNVSRELLALLREAGFQPKDTTRNSNYITYFKQSEYIEDFFTAIGAPISAMGIMNAKVEKNLRGSVNRRVNCDAANLDKVVAAAGDQIEAIHRLAVTCGLDSLPDKLRDTASLRLEFPELTLSQLAELSDPPVTKSCLNHRLRKLMELSKG